MSKLRRIARRALIVVTAIRAGVGICWKFGCGGKTYFLIDTLNCRAHREVLVPIVNVPIDRSSRTTYRNPLVRTLIEKGYWSPQIAKRDPMLIGHWNVQSRDGDSDFQRQLRESERYIKWTEANPKFTAEFWPNILKRLRANDDSIHMEVPALMRYALLFS